MHRPTDIIDDMIDLREAYATISDEDDRMVAYLKFVLDFKECQIKRALNNRYSQPTISRKIKKLRVLLNSE